MRLTEPGYVGEDVETVVLNLLQNCDSEGKRTETGVSYLNEIDKTSHKSENPSLTRDVSGEGVQQVLLNLVKGTICNGRPKADGNIPNKTTIRLRAWSVCHLRRLRRTSHSRETRQSVSSQTRTPLPSTT